MLIDSLLPSQFALAETVKIFYIDVVLNEHM